MQRLEVSSAVQPIYGSLGVKRLSIHTNLASLASHFDGRIKTKAIPATARSKACVCDRSLAIMDVCVFWVYVCCQVKVSASG